MEGIVEADRAAERQAQVRQRDKGTWTTVCEDLDLDISNGKLKCI